MRLSTFGTVCTAVVFCAFFLPGCSTIQQDVIANPTGEQEFRELDGLEVSLTEQRAAVEAAGGRIEPLVAQRLEVLRGRAEALSEESSYNDQYTARLEALRGMEALISGSLRRAERHLEAAREAWELDETAMVLQSLLMEDPGERLEFLDDRITAGDELHRLEAERGAALFELGNYGEAVAAWDASLPFLPEAWSSLFFPRREKAWALKDTDGGLDSRSVDLIGDGPVSLGVMLEITSLESSLLEDLGEDATPLSGRFFDFLTERGWFLPSSERDDMALRRDAALFLWHLLAHKTGDEAMLTRYSDRFDGRQSPIPDVSSEDPWFDGVLGCVQFEIMALPDGRRFFGEDPATGMEFIEWLGAVLDY